MDKILETYSHILREHLSRFFVNRQNIDPIELNKERFKTKAVFIAAIIFLKNNPNRDINKITTSANNWFRDTFANENLFSSIIDNSCENLKKHIDDNLCNLIGVELIDVPTLYEKLLSVESINESNRTETSTAKNYRNNLGSYYTPSNLAKAVTQKTIDTFFNLNFSIEKMSSTGSDNLSQDILENIALISFADFSCGGGAFLIEVICYFERLFSKLKIEETKKIELLKSIALNIHAFDVDCLALEVAKLNLLLRINQPGLYINLSETFIHANFLLQQDFPIVDSNKVEVFSSGFIYHEQLSLNKDKLKKYDVILGNPPWEKIRFEEKMFYALYSNTISDNHFKSSRTNEIYEAESKHIQLSDFSTKFKFEIEKAKSDIKKNSFFDLSNNGELNTYALFTDAAVKLKTKRGVVGLVLKSAIVTSQVNQNLFNHLSKGNIVIAIYDFINRKKIFDIDSRERFCFLLLGNSRTEKFNVSMNIIEVDEIEKNKSVIVLSYDGLMLMNPVTGMLPNFTTKAEADFLLRVSKDFPFFKKTFKNVRFGRIVHFTSHAEFISKQKTDNNIPIYEGKFFNQFDGRFSGFNGVNDDLRFGNKTSSVKLDESNKRISDYFPESRFFINKEKWLQLSKNHNEKFMLVWRSLTSATNTRTCIATVLPFIPASQSVQFLTTNQNDLLYLAGLFNSVTFDFILKKKLGGIDLTQSVINQIPVPDNEQISRILNFNNRETTIKHHISLLVSTLLRNDVRLKPLIEHLDNGFEKNDSRLEIIRKIDLLFIYLYNLNDLELELIINEFSKQYTKKDLKWFTNELNQL